MVLKPHFLLPSSRNQVTLTQVLQMQDELWASLSNPHAAMEELAGENLPVPHVVICPQDSSGKGWRWEY